MKKIISAIMALFGVFIFTGCVQLFYLANHNPNTSLVGDEISISIPRELFFTMGSEESILEFFGYFGGIVTKPLQDQDAFWRENQANPGTVNIEASFSPTNLMYMVYIIYEEIHWNLHLVTNFIESIYGTQIESDDAFTRFIFIADIDELANDFRIIELLDFTFPITGQLEYLRRVLSLYDMAAFSDILFYFADYYTEERFKVYSFLDDAPLGLSMRHKRTH
ncbi:MAG: hypothetical protein FWC95_08260 [Defluviitaleaceae bacterium]|nr:hypothetical protein [Defluviitaleaceae bacterium]